MALSELVTNWKVYGLEDSFKASKYPMAVDINKCTADYTKTIKKLFICGFLHSKL